MEISKKDFHFYEQQLIINKSNSNECIELE